MIDNSAASGQDMAAKLKDALSCRYETRPTNGSQGGGGAMYRNHIPTRTHGNNNQGVEAVQYAKVNRRGFSSTAEHGHPDAQYAHNVSNNYGDNSEAIYDTVAQTEDVDYENGPASTYGGSGRDAEVVQYTDVESISSSSHGYRRMEHEVTQYAKVKNRGSAYPAGSGYQVGSADGSSEGIYDVATLPEDVDYENGPTSTYGGNGIDAEVVQYTDVASISSSSHGYRRTNNEVTQYAKVKNRGSTYPAGSGYQVGSADGSEGIYDVAALPEDADYENGPTSTYGGNGIDAEVVQYTDVASISSSSHGYRRTNNEVTQYAKVKNRGSTYPAGSGYQVGSADGSEGIYDVATLPEDADYENGPTSTYGGNGRDVDAMQYADTAVENGRDPSSVWDKYPNAQYAHDVGASYDDGSVYDDAALTEYHRTGHADTHGGSTMYLEKEGIQYTAVESLYDTGDASEVRDESEEEYEEVGQQRSCERSNPKNEVRCNNLNRQSAANPVKHADPGNTSSRSQQNRVRSNPRSDVQSDTRHQRAASGNSDLSALIKRIRGAIPSLNGRKSSISCFSFLRPNSRGKNTVSLSEQLGDDVYDDACMPLQNTNSVGMPNASRRDRTATAVVQQGITSGNIGHQRANESCGFPVLSKDIQEGRPSSKPIAVRPKTNNRGRNTVSLSEQLGDNVHHQKWGEQHSSGHSIERGWDREHDGGHGHRNEAPARFRQHDNRVHSNIMGGRQGISMHHQQWGTRPSSHLSDVSSHENVGNMSLARGR